MLVETSTPAGKSETAVRKAEADLQNAIAGFQKNVQLQTRCRKAFSYFPRRHPKGKFILALKYSHDVENNHPVGHLKENV